MVNYTYCNTAFAIMRDLAVNSLLSISLGMKKIPLEVSPGVHFCVKEPKVGLGKLKSYFLFWGEGFSGVLAALTSSRIREFFWKAPLFSKIKKFIKRCIFLQK